MQMFGTGLCLYFFRGPNPTDCFYFKHVEIVLLNFIYPKTVDPNPFSIVVPLNIPTHHPHNSYPKATLLVVLLGAINNPNQSKLILEHAN